MVFAYFIYIAASCWTVTSQIVFDPLLPTPKTWWSKEILRDIPVAGRLTESQIKYVAEVGFKAVISIPTLVDPAWIGEEYFPSTDEERDLVINELGLFFGVVNEPGDFWDDIESVERLTALLDVAPRPTMVHCSSSYQATFNVLSYLANQTVVDPGFQPKVNSSVLYDWAAAIGHFFNGTSAKITVAEITGEPEVVNPPQPDGTISNWRDYWLMKPVMKNIYVAGQVKSNYDFKVLNLFDTIVNGRKRVQDPAGIPAQEEVTLLNILDGTGTYNSTGRQSEERLQQTRVDPNKPNSYISDNSTVNYQSRNYLEFGDDVGYNEDVEQTFWEGKGLQYNETAIGGEYGYDLNMWTAYKDTWLVAAQDGNDVLFKCQRGIRAVVSAVLTAGEKFGLDSDWAINRANQLGFHLEEAGEDAAVQLIRDVLG